MQQYNQVLSLTFYPFQRLKKQNLYQGCQQKLCSVFVTTACCNQHLFQRLISDVEWFPMTLCEALCIIYLKSKGNDYFQLTAFQHKNYEKIKKSLGGDVLVALPLQYTPLGTLQDIFAPIALLKNYQFLTKSLIFEFHTF